MFGAGGIVALRNTWEMVEIKPKSRIQCRTISKSCTRNDSRSGPKRSKKVGEMDNQHWNAAAHLNYVLKINY